MATRKSRSSKPRNTSTRSRSSRSIAKPKAQKEAGESKVKEPAAAKPAAKATPAPKATEPAKKAPAKAVKVKAAAKPAAGAKKTEPKKKPTTKAAASKVEAPKPEAPKATAAPKVEPKKTAEAAKTPAKAEAPVKAEKKPEPATAKAAPAAKAALTAKEAPKETTPAAKSEPKPAAKKEEPKPTPATKEAPKAAAPAAKPEPKPAAEKKAAPAPAPKEEPKAAAKPKPATKAAKPEPAAKPTAAKREEHTKKTEALKPAVAKVEEAPAAKPAVKSAPANASEVERPAPKAAPEAKKAEEPKKEAEAAKFEKAASKKPTKVEERPRTAAEAPATEPAPATAKEAPAEKTAEPEAAPEPEPELLPQPRRSIAFIGSECYPFVKTGGLGDVMYALPKALVKQNCDVKVILPRYACIKQEWQEKMVYKGAFQMDLCSDGRQFYVGIMEYISPDGVVYDFIDNQDFFTNGNPYTNLVDDIPRYCYFGKAALSALLFLNWIPDIIHCHDWQAALVPVYLRTLFQNTELARSKTVLTIHNLRFQGKYNIPTIKYWSGLPDYVFNKDAMQEDWTEANMLKGGLTYADMITTVSGTYAEEIQTPEYGEGLDAHLHYHSGKLRGIVNGIDYDIWNPATDKLLEAPYDTKNVIDAKKENKKALQEELGLEQDDGKMVIGLISRLTSQKGLDLVTTVMEQLIDGNTQVVVLGTGEPQYEESFRWFENAHKGTVCSSIMYDEARSHHIYAGADALLVPSRFEPCGLTQLIAMHYGTIPVVRETGGLKDTVEPYNMFEDSGNGFTFDRYEPGLLLEAINRAKMLYFTSRESWDKMVKRDMEKNISWSKSASQYRDLYLQLTQ
jgi:ADP-glucose type glycogen/starch synthase